MAIWMTYVPIFPPLRGGHNPPLSTASGLAAADFFMVKALTCAAWFATRVVRNEAEDAHGGDRRITCLPEEAWTTQLLAISPMSATRDPLYTASFRRLLRDCGS